MITLVQLIHFGSGFILQTVKTHSDGQQFHQYQQNKQPPLSNDGQQFHQYQQNEQPPLSNDGWLFVLLILVESLTIIA
jgi:hypothetical protein